MSVASAVCNLCQEWTQIASNDERVLLRLLTPTPGNPAPTVMGHYCLQNAARRVHGSAQAHPSAGLPLPLPCPCIQDLPRPTRAEHLASRLQPDKPRGYRFHARTAHHSHRRRHPLLQPRRHQLLQHHPHALPCPKKITAARSAGQTTLRAHIASPARLCLPGTRTSAHSGVHKVNNCTKSNEKRNRRRSASTFFLFQFSHPVNRVHQ